MWKLTHGQVHVTDVSNAARTMLFNVHTNQWDDELLALLRIPKALLPEVLPSSAHFGDTAADLLGHPIRIGGVAGDQQSALFGQACFTAGMAKNTYGTGCFMLMHTGGTFQTSQNGLLTTSAAQATVQPEFAMEGSVFVGGAVVQWLRDGLRAISTSNEVESLAQSVPDSGGVMMVPAFTGLGAPYWKPDAAIVDVLVRKSLAALKQTGLKRMVVAGGVGANRTLRAPLNAECAKLRVRGGI